ncbi:hypothetical protein CCAX7_54850 [Capsulimonas corticalis]|uniref:Uncharacterized protein n=1 Tax=Capsulimonas corticalis TaxID=2219043 RepID=A0A402D5N7_9BACT|nr:hypothetical protein [Capsulimonas corticalis]BDI33434.1 hypothetical protein CCAX7_54850 [Capsulimonas corticalis]
MVEKAKRRFCECAEIKCICDDDEIETTIDGQGKIGMCCGCGASYSPSRTKIVNGVEYGPCCLGDW